MIKKVWLVIVKELVLELVLGLVVITFASIIAFCAGLIKQNLYGNIGESLMTVAFEGSLIGYGIGRYVSYRKHKFALNVKEVSDGS